MKLKDLTGQRFGRLTVLSCTQKAYTDSNGKQFRTLWACMCDCGAEWTAESNNLKTGHTTSCGCAQVDACTKHGECGHPLYKIWLGIKQRCSDPSNKDWAKYGGRGVLMHPEWAENPSAFFAYVDEHLGTRPSMGHSIDRIDNLCGNYAPGSIRWADRLTQANNKRTNVMVTYNGVTRTASEWCRELNMCLSTILGRIRRGLTPEMAFSMGASGFKKNSR